jgi:REP element-mobilizing transposase RayT
VARPPRIEFPDAIYHVSARGNERKAIYRAHADRHHFLELLAEAVERRRWRVLAYCLMSNHYHLLVQTPAPDLARGLRQLNGVYAQSFNRRHGRVGHLFQGRYGARLVQEDRHLLEVVRYVVRNPVRAGLCETPQGWRWSSHRAALGETATWFLARKQLLSYFGGSDAHALARYRAHCEVDSSELGRHPLVEGDPAFVTDVLAAIDPTPGVPQRYLERARPALAEFLTSRDGDALVQAREHGYGVREIARQLGIAPSTVSRRLRAERLGATGET